jgi:protease I
MAAQLQGRRVAFLATDGVEQVELTTPWEAVERAGGSPELLSTSRGGVRGFHHLEPADSFSVDQPVAAADVGDYDALVLPGGVANPDALRTDRAAVRFVREFADTGRPLAAICHAPWLLVEADVVADREVTSYPSLRTDLTNAGAQWRDEEVVQDGSLITSRDPDDLPAFCDALVRAIAATPTSRGGSR